MRVGLLIIGLLIGALLQGQTLKEVREQYEIANHKESVAELLANSKGFSDPVLLGYKASAKMLLAKHYWNPYAKFASFVEGRNELEALISSNLYNFELRYLRLIIQCNCPIFLGYNKQINEDKLFVIQHFQQFLGLPENREFADKVLSYLKTLNVFSEQEIELLLVRIN